MKNNDICTTMNELGLKKILKQLQEENRKQRERIEELQQKLEVYYKLTNELKNIIESDRTASRKFNAIIEDINKAKSFPDLFQRLFKNLKNNFKKINFWISFIAEGRFSEFIVQGLKIKNLDMETRISFVSEKDFNKTIMGVSETFLDNGDLNKYSILFPVKSPQLIKSIAIIPLIIQYEDDYIEIIGSLNLGHHDQEHYSPYDKDTDLLKNLAGILSSKMSFFAR